jgi:hypothetical protein
MAAGNVKFDSLLSTTLDNYRKTLTDNVFKSRVLLWWLTEKNRVRKLSGGVNINEPLIYAEGQTGSYGEWDAIQIVPQEGMTSAQFPWRQLFATISISGLEEAQNNGEEAVINLLDAKVMQAEETMKANLNRMLYSDGTGNSGKDILGLKALIGDATTTPTTVGGIDSSDAANVWWRSYVNAMAGTVKAPGLSAYLGTAFNTVSDGNDMVDGIFAAQNSYEAYEAGLTPNVRYQDTKSANAGFSNLMLKQCPVYWDRDCTAGYVYGLNSKYIELVGHTDRWFKQSPFSDGLSAQAGGAATTVDARYSIITTYGNLTIRNRARHFKCTAVINNP